MVHGLWKQNWRHDGGNRCERELQPTVDHVCLQYSQWSGTQEPGTYTDADSVPNMGSPWLWAMKEALDEQFTCYIWLPQRNTVVHDARGGQMKSEIYVAVYDMCCWLKPWWYPLVWCFSGSWWCECSYLWFLLPLRVMSGSEALQQPGSVLMSMPGWPDKAIWIPVVGAADRNHVDVHGSCCQWGATIMWATCTATWGHGDVLFWTANKSHVWTKSSTVAGVCVDVWGLCCSLKPCRCPLAWS